MYDIAPTCGVGNSFALMAAHKRVMISDLATPASASSVRLFSIGRTDRAACGLRHTGARNLGFQNSGSENGACQLRSTRQTNPFLPLTAVRYPCGVNTRISASFDMESGAAVRASVISASGSLIKYCSSGAMLRYGCARASGLAGFVGSWPAPVTAISVMSKISLAVDLSEGE